NVKSVEVRWPAPRRFIDEGGETVGYKNRVIFPLHVRPADPNLPARLVIDAFFAVCKEVCIPAEERRELSSWEPDARWSVFLNEFEARVRAAITSSSPFRVSAGRVVPNGTSLDLVLAIEGTAPPDLDIFVEGRGTAYFRAPRDGGSGTYLIAVDGVTD